MKSKILFLLSLFVFFLGSSAYTQENLRRAHLFRAENSNAENLKVLNIISNSSMYAYWNNRALNGNGTNSIYMTTTPESTPAQFLRLLSLFDIYLTHSVISMEHESIGKKHFVYFSTPMSRADMASYPVFSLTGNKELTAIFYSLFPTFLRARYKAFTSRDILYFTDGPLFSSQFRQKIYGKLKQKLDYLWNQAFNLVNSKDKMEEVLKGIVLPITSLSDLHIDKNGDSYYTFDFYIPGLVTINQTNSRGEKSDNPLDWTIKPGLEQVLPEPMMGLTQVANTLSYMMNVPEEKRFEALKNKLINVKFTKNIRKPDELGLTLAFGQLPDQKNLDALLEEENKKKKKLNVFPLDITKREGALGMTGYINMLKGGKLNKYLNKIHLQSWIHQIALDLKRPKKYKSWAARFSGNPTFKLAPNMKKTVISARLRKGANRRAHKGLLQAMGFTCKKGNKFMEEDNIEVFKDYKYTCVMDMATSKVFKSKFQKKISRSFMTKITSGTTKDELDYSLEGLDKMGEQKIQLENAVAAEFIKLLKRNMLVIELLNLLPGNITPMLEGI